MLAGIILKLMIHVLRGNDLIKLFSPITKIQKSDDTVHIIIDGPLTFLGYMKLKNIIAQASKESLHIIVNLNAITYMDLQDSI